MMPTATPIPALRNLVDDFDLRKFAARHFQMHFLHRQFKERGKKRGVPAQAHGPAFVVPKAKMGGEAAPADYRSDSLSKDLDEAAGILPMGIAAHRGFIECDFITANFDQLLEFFSNNWNQRLGDVPAVLIYTAGIDSTAQSVGPGNACLQHRPGRRDLLQALEFFHRSQSMRGAYLSCDLVFSALVVRRRPEAARRNRSAANAFQLP